MRSRDSGRGIQGAKGRDPGVRLACLRGSRVCQGPLSPGYFIFCLCRRPQAWEPQATCPVLPSSGMSPREGWSSASQTPCPPPVCPPCVVAPLLGTPSFYLKALTVTQGLAPEPSIPQTLASPKGPVLTEPQATDRGRGWGTWLLGARAPHVKPRGQGGTKLGTLSMHTLPSPFQWVPAG